MSMNGSERTIPHSKVSEGAASPAEEIPRERGGARPGRAAAHTVCKVIRVRRRGGGVEHEEEENQEHGNRVYANILTKKKQS